MATCYLLTQCDGLVDPFIVSNNLSNFVGQTIKICPADLPQLSTPTGGIPIPPNPNDPYNTLYDLVDCCGIQPSITIKNNAGPLLNYIVNLPSIGPSTCWTVKKSTLNIQPAVIVDTTGGTYFTSCNICTQTAPCAQNLPVLTECLCFTVSEAQTCEGAINLVSVGISYENCYYCKGPCYKLTDCEGILPDIITNTDISEYVGSIIKISTCPDTCWIVGLSDSCTGVVTLPTVTGSWETCEECLPPVLPPPPVELITRRVKPGYYTKGCPPEYTEKISCKFGDTMFDDVARVRYGIDICCDHDVEKWWIKKELLNLKAIYDPALDCPPKRCYCYTIEQVAGTTDYKYISCEGDCTTITVSPGDTQYVCSQTWPNALCPPEGSLYNITSSEELCTTSGDCFLPPPPPPDCECYAVKALSRTSTYSYTACDGQVFTDILFVKTVYLCAQVGTITGNEIEIQASGNTCEKNDDCLPCNCTFLTRKSFAELVVEYVDCATKESLQITVANVAAICAVSGTVNILEGEADRDEGGNCTENEDCLPPIPTCACTVLVNTSTTTTFNVQYVTCSGQSVGLNLNPGSYHQDCILNNIVQLEPGSESFVQVNAYEACSPFALCSLPTCQCVEITNLSLQPSAIKYTDCQTQQVINLQVGETPVYVCTNRPVQTIYGQVSVSVSTAPCSTNLDCQPAPTCLCYEVIVTDAGTIEYIDCEGLLVSLPIFDPSLITVCARENTIQVISGNITVGPSGADCSLSGVCSNTCICYSFLVTNGGGSLVYYYDCPSGLLTGVTLNQGVQTICSRGTPFSQDPTVYPFVAGSGCTGGIPGTCATACACHRISNPNEVTITIQATHCETQQVITFQVLPGQDYYACAIAGTVSLIDGPSANINVIGICGSGLTNCPPA